MNQIGERPEAGRPETKSEGLFQSIAFINPEAHLPVCTLKNRLMDTARCHLAPGTCIQAVIQEQVPGSHVTSPRSTFRNTQLVKLLSALQHYVLAFLASRRLYMKLLYHHFPLASGDALQTSGKECPEWQLQKVISLNLSDFCKRPLIKPSLPTRVSGRCDILGGIAL